jgi:hypothetical protein
MAPRSAIGKAWPAAVAAVALFGVLIFVLGWVAVWATPPDKDRAAAVNATRQTFLAAAAGLVAIAGLVTGARTYLLSRDGQLTDRFANAVSLLASDKHTERIGGIYALERLIQESARDHDMIVEVLAAHIRQCARNLPTAAMDDDRLVVQAALTVLGRRPVRPEANEVNLAGADLRGLSFADARLRHADLRNCLLQDANLTLADCRGALLSGADLSGARLIAADLRGADLRAAVLYGADVDGASLGGTDLGSALLGGVPDRPDVCSLTGEQLRAAVLDGDTELPSSLRSA